MERRTTKNDLFRCSFVLGIALLLLQGCGSKPVSAPSLRFEVPQQHKGKSLCLFFDGTDNDRDTFTNVRRLYEIVSNRHDPRVITYYDEGVGTDIRRLTGNALGFGFSRNVREAYSFLAEHYEEGDKIYLFGFSRGAYTARALTGVLYIAGLLSRTDFRSDEKFKRAVRDVYSAYKDSPLKPPYPQVDELKKKFLFSSVEVEVIALWDTVEALGLPGPRHQYHKVHLHPNVKRAYHVLALDERRKYYRPELWKEESTGNQIVEQVWFAGMHSDVGGGYKDSKDLAGISLNWIIEKIEGDGILREGGSYRVFEHSLGRMHDSSRGIFKLGIFDKEDRELPDGSTLHRSVIERIEAEKLPFPNLSREQGKRYHPPAILNKCPAIDSSVDGSREDLLVKCGFKIAD